MLLVIFTKLIAGDEQGQVFLYSFKKNPRCGTETRGDIAEVTKGRDF